MAPALDRAVDLRVNVGQLAGWIPIRVYWQEGRPWLDWCYLGQERFEEPFFDQTIERALRRPFSLLFRHQTPIEILAQARAALDCVPPSGFIFHMSRCGSTLISQMLAALPRNIVISEASPIDSILNAPWRNPALTEEERLAWFQWIVTALGQKRNREEEHFFIKFYSSHALHLPLIHRAFPGVPWIFVYRDPLEVMVSHHRNPSGQLLPRLSDPRLGDLDQAAAWEFSPDEHCARALARICAAALENLGTGPGLLISYRELPGVVADSLLNSFHLRVTEAELERMQRASRFSAKDPSLMFADDSAAKQRDATDEIRQLANRWLRPLYDRLEIARAARDKFRG